MGSDFGKLIREGQTVLGIEFGSTRIKGVLIDDKGTPIASGSHEWENSLIDGIWTYSLDEVKEGLQDCYRDLAENVKKEFGEELTSFKAIGISAMMHGYLAFDENDGQLAQYHYGRSLRKADGGIPLPYSAALEHCPSVSGHPERRGACAAGTFLHHAGRICALGTDRTEGPRNRRRLGHVPHRQLY